MFLFAFVSTGVIINADTGSELSSTSSSVEGAAPSLSNTNSDAEGTAPAYTDESGVTYTYSISGEGEGAFAVITGLDSSTLPSDGIIQIPAAIDSYPVKEIGTEAFVSNQSITGVVIPEGIERLEESCFNNCQNIGFIGSSVGSYALPESINYIGRSAFSQAGMPEMTIPDSVHSISANAFAYCSKLAKVNLPDTLTTIDEYGFYECTGLKTVDFPATLTSIGRQSFGHAGLTSVNIPAGLTDIGDAAFERCVWLGEFNVDPENPEFTSVDGNLYTKDGRTLLQYPAGRTDAEYTLPVPSQTLTIAVNAFAKAENLQRLVLPEGVTAVGEYAFLECYGLESIELPDTLMSIGPRAFAHCQKLTEIEVPGSVGAIEEQTFLLCTSLEKVVLEKGIKKIGNQAFSCCFKLKELTIPDTVDTISQDMLESAGIMLGEGESMKIIGFKDSAGEAFAKENGIEFERAVNPVSQSISVRTVQNYTYGTKPFALGASAKSPLTYLSNNPKIAVVSKNGQVTLKGIGTVVIYVSAKETNDYLAAQTRVTINVKPAKASIKVKNLRKRKVKITWAKVAGADGYEVYIKSPGKKKYVKRATRNANVKSITHSRLKKGKTYRYKVRAFTKVNGKKVYGQFSKVKKIKIKR